VSLPAASFFFPPPLLAWSVQDLPAVDAALNATATVLLVIGYVLIKGGREQAHKWTMLTAFAVSVVFLACYLTYHFHPGHLVRRPGSEAPDWFRRAYYGMLLTHVVLAAAVPFLAMATIYYGLRDRRAAHRRIARWTFPIWLYVSITGVLVYAVLYHLYPEPAAKPIMPVSSVEPAASAGAISVGHAQRARKLERRSIARCACPTTAT
jgi:putative membrane protein